MMYAGLLKAVQTYQTTREELAVAREDVYLMAKAAYEDGGESELEELVTMLEWNLASLKQRLGLLPNNGNREPKLSIRERVMPLLPTEWEKAEKTYERISGLLGVAEPTIKKIVKSIAHDGEIEFKGYATKYMGREGFRQTEYRRPTDLGL